jgi:uncharacterized RDD family membrane protein YckC
MTQQPSGWYDDPSNPDLLRYWDGVTWTNHTAPKKSPTASQSTIGLPQAQNPTTPLPQGGGWQAQNPQQQGPGGYETGTQFPGQHAGAGQSPYPYGGQYPGAPQSQTWMRGPVTSDGVPLASWGKRLGAWLIDGVIILVVGGAFGWFGTPQLGELFGELGDAASSNDPATIEAITQDLTGPMVQMSLIMWLFATVYCILFWTTTAQTPGKMVIGISVRAADRPGPLTLGTSVLRRLVPLAGQFIPFLSLLDGLWPLWDNQRQALHDKVAKTVVVEGKQPRRQG